MACRMVDGRASGNLKAMGIKVLAGTWTSYVKDVGMILSEDLERERRDPANKYSLAQWDEVAMGKESILFTYFPLIMGECGSGIHAHSTVGRYFYWDICSLLLCADTLLAKMLAI